MNQEIDALIAAVLQHAANNGNPVRQSLTLASVRLLKRFAAQQNDNELTLLALATERLMERATRLNQATSQAVNTVLAANDAAIRAAIAGANIPD